MDDLQLSDSEREKIEKTLQDLSQLSEGFENQDDHKSRRSHESQPSSLSVTDFNGQRPQNVDESPKQESKSSRTSSISSKAPPQNNETNLKSSQKSESSQSEAPKGPQNLVSLIPAMNSPVPDLVNQPPESQNNNPNATKEIIFPTSPSSEQTAPPKRIYPTISSLSLSQSSSNLPVDDDFFPTITQPLIIDTSLRSGYQGTAPGRGRGRMKKKEQTQIEPKPKETADDVVPLDNVEYTEEGKKIKPETIRRPRMKRLPPPTPIRKSVPYFIIIASLVQAFLMAWTLILNGGFESFQMNPMFGPSALTLIVAGGKWVEYIRHRGEWWRLVTPIFLHGGLIHLGFNLFVQLPVGLKLERLHGTFRVFAVYMLCGLFGNIISAIFLPFIVTVGASGSLFGFFGVLLVDLIKNWKHVPKPKRSLAIMLGGIIFSFLMGLLPGVDNFAHLGGFIMGVLSGIVFIPAMHIGAFDKKKRALQVGIVLPFIIILTVGLITVIYFAPIDSQWCSWCKYISCLPVFDCGP